MHDNPEETARITIYIAKIMGAIGGVTLGCGLALGGVLWVLWQLIKHLAGR
jgi:hypothetical protein